MIIPIFASEGHFSSLFFAKPRIGWGLIVASIPRQFLPLCKLYDWGFRYSFDHVNTPAKSAPVSKLKSLYFFAYALLFTLKFTS